MKVLLLLLLFFAFANVASGRAWPVEAPDPVPTLSAAQIIAGLEPEPISCLNSSDWAAMGISDRFDGYARFNQPHIYVRDYVCEDLVTVAQGIVPANPVTAQAAKIIAHEHSHVLGVVDESQAECAGVRGAPAILEKLGVPADRAEELAAQIVPFYPLPADC